jgi:uncharacterized protein YPO0396
MELAFNIATVAVSLIIAMLGALASRRALQLQTRQWKETEIQRRVEAQKVESERQKLEEEITSQVLRRAKDHYEGIFVDLQRQITDLQEENQKLRTLIDQREQYHEARYKELEKQHNALKRDSLKREREMAARIKELEKKNGTGPLKEEH